MGDQKTSQQESRRGAEIRIEDRVVSKIAGLAAQEIEGVRDLGGGTSRALGGVLESVPGIDAQTRGVSVEVGEKEAAVDITLAVDYGKKIPQITEAVRKAVISNVEKFSGFRVKEVNITVSDIIVPDGDGQRQIEAGGQDVRQAASER